MGEIFAGTAFPQQRLLSDSHDYCLILLDGLLAFFPVLGAFIGGSLAGFIWIKERHKSSLNIISFLLRLAGKYPIFGILKSILLYRRLDIHIRPDECYIILAGVLPGRQRVGIGGRMFEKLFHDMKLKQKKYIRLHLETENIKALHFYLKYGFCKTVVQESKVKNIRYYLMQKIISSN